ncbi:hypothetical protein [Acidisoma sp. C75]
MAEEQIPPVEVLDPGAGPVLYRVAVPPAEMPPVPVHALEGALDAARSAARQGGETRPRRFRFAAPGGAVADFTISDRDARFWAQAVDRTADLGTLGGLSLCLRLLALVDLLGTAPWAARYLRASPDGPRMDRGLLRAAARTNLTEEARFNEASFRRNLPLAQAGGTPAPTAFTGVSS